MDACFILASRSLSKQQIGHSFEQFVSDRAYIKTILNFRKDAKAYHLTSAPFYKDQAGKMDAVNPLADLADANKGLKECHAHTSASKSVAMEGRIHSDLFAIDRYILGVVRIKINLVRSRNPLRLVLFADNPDFKVVLEQYMFRVSCVKVPSITILTHTNQAVKYPIDCINCKVFSVAIRNLSENQANIFQGPLSARVVIEMVDADPILWHISNTVAQESF